MSRTARTPWAALAAAAVALSVAPARAAPPPTPAAPASTTPTPSWPSASPSRGCASTRPRCRRSPTPTTAPRVSGSPGYDDSVDYVVQRLRAAGYTPRRPGVRLQHLRLAGPVRRRARGTRADRPGGEHDPQLLRQRRRDGAGHRAARAPRSTGHRAARPPTSPASRSAPSPWSAVASAPSRSRRRTRMPRAPSAVVIVNNAAGDLNGTLGEAFALDIPVTSVTQVVGDQLAATRRPGAARDDLHVPWPGHDVQRARRDPQPATTATS